MCLAVLMLCSGLPLEALAAEYYVELKFYSSDISKDDTIQPGDVIYIEKDEFAASSSGCTYMDEDGTTLLCSDMINPTESTVEKNSIYYYRREVKTYTAAGGTDGSMFDHWKVTQISASGYTGGHAKFTLQAVMRKSISYELDGGTNHPDNPSSYLEGTSGGTLKDASKEHYDFKGWYTTSDYQESSKVTEIAADWTGNKTLYAKFTPKQYLIDYKIPHGFNIPSDVRRAAGLRQNYSYGDTVNLSGELSGKTVTWEGATCTGWYDDEALTIPVTDITPTTNGTKIVYGKFEAPITYHMGEGETNPAENPRTYIYGISAELRDAVKEPASEYSFEHWHRTPSLDSQSTVYGVNAEWRGGIDLYPKFNANSYDITYCLPNGTPLSEEVRTAAALPANYTYGTAVSLSGKTVEWDGVTSSGWYSDAELTQPMTEISATDTGNKTVYVKLEASITYVVDSAKGESHPADNPVKYIYGKPSVIKPAVKEPASEYTFEGWYTTADFQEGTELASITASQRGNLTLYPKFTVKTYEITYLLPDGTELPESVTGSLPANYTYGIGTSLSGKTAQWEGVTCSSWYSDADFTSTVTGISVTDTGNKTIYAKFEAPITYVVDAAAGESCPADNPTKYIYGVGISRGVIADAEKTPKGNYRFSGWYNESGSKVTAILASQRGSVTLTAKFEKKKAAAGNRGQSGNEAPQTRTVSGGSYSEYCPSSYTITYLLPDGSRLPASVTKTLPSRYTYGSGADLTKRKVTWGDATCLSWYSHPDLKDSHRVKVIVGTETGNKILYAKFIAPITYIVGKGESCPSTNPTGYIYGKGVSSDALGAAVKSSGGVFNGWYDLSGSRVTEIPGSQRGGVTLKAGFRAGGKSTAAGAAEEVQKTAVKAEETKNSAEDMTTVKGISDPAETAYEERIELGAASGERPEKAAAEAVTKEGFAGIWAAAAAVVIIGGGLFAAVWNKKRKGQMKQ